MTFRDVSVPTILSFLASRSRFHSISVHTLHLSNQRIIAAKMMRFFANLRRYFILGQWLIQAEDRFCVDCCSQSLRCNRNPSSKAQRNLQIFRT